jgi:hypothetical protein
MGSRVLFTAIASFSAVVAVANQPPDAPVILEPAGEMAVSPADVHMVTAGFTDPDRDEHLCTDWEIVAAGSLDRVWRAPCAGGHLRTHIHLGDGAFSVAEARMLAPAERYLLRVRFRDDSGEPSTEWSGWTEQAFETAGILGVAPMLLSEVVPKPSPAWVDPDGDDLILPKTSEQSAVRIESPGETLFLEIRSLDGGRNQWILPGAGGAHEPVRVSIENGSSVKTLDLPASRIDFLDEEGRERAIYLPELALGAGESVLFWISSNGGSHHGEATETEPDFSRIARGAPVPWQVTEPGYTIEIAAEGFQLPVAIAFPPGAGEEERPFFYVGELYGNIRAVSRDGSVSDYATNLLNFDPLGEFPGAGEIGMAGLVVEPESGDLFASMLYLPENQPVAHFFPRVIRLQSDDGGWSASRSETVLDLFGETQGPSHQISNLSIGPDRKLYVHMADGPCIPCARDLDSFRGKILRANLDGSAPEDNPFYDPTDGISAADYVYAYGFRNHFGGAWRDADQHLYQVENGPAIDRLVRVVPGTDYRWDGTDLSMDFGAIHTWIRAAPVNLAIVQNDTFGGSGFPWWKQDTLYVTESGATWATGPQFTGKMISEFVVTPAGELGGNRRVFVEYDGSGKATAAALAAGPDGLYFSDLYPDEELENPTQPSAKIFRVRRTEAVSFTAEVSRGGSGCGTVSFTDESTMIDASSWSWEFGDGGSSDAQTPVHHYEQCGTYLVQLSVGTGSGRSERRVEIGLRPVTPQGLLGTYFSDTDMKSKSFERIDPMVDFAWEEAPVPGEGSEYSVRWTGRVMSNFSQTYRFTVESPGGVRLWVDGRLVIDDLHEVRPGTRSGSVAMRGGRLVPIRLEHTAASTAVSPVRLLWSSESQMEEVIPQENLSPEGAPRRRTVGRR